MKTQTTTRFIGCLSLIATFLLSAVAAFPQNRRIYSGNEVALPRGGCPKPTSLTLNATSPNVVNADFSPGMLAAPRAFLNDPLPNKSFLYTFQWKSEQRCCEATSAVLTVTFKANQGGYSNTSSDAGNDGFAIMHLGATVPGSGGAIYTSWPFNAGNTVTRTWNLTGQVLNNMNSTHRLSIYGQDDTKVVSATLQVSGCCLSSSRPNMVDQAQFTQ